MQLLKHEDGQLKLIKEEPIKNAFKVGIAFSHDGNYFSLYRKKLNVLQIYKIQNHDMVQLFEDFVANKCLKHIEGNKELKFGQQMYFDRKNRYLCCYGKQLVNVISLQS